MGILYPSLLYIGISKIWIIVANRDNARIAFNNIKNRRLQTGIAYYNYSLTGSIKSFQPSFYFSK